VTASRNEAFLAARKEKENGEDPSQLAPIRRKGRGKIAEHLSQKKRKREDVQELVSRNGGQKNPQVVEGGATKAACGEGRGGEEVSALQKKRERGSLKGGELMSATAGKSRAPTRSCLLSADGKEENFTLKRGRVFQGRKKGGNQQLLWRGQKEKKGICINAQQCKGEKDLQFPQRGGDPNKGKKGRLSPLPRKGKRKEKRTGGEGRKSKVWLKKIPSEKGGKAEGEEGKGEYRSQREKV